MAGKFAPLQNASDAPVHEPFSAQNMAVNQPGDRWEKEADRAADAVIKGQPVSNAFGFSFTHVPVTQVQRQDAKETKAPSKESDEQKYKKALTTAGEAALKTEAGKKLLEKVENDRLVKDGKKFFESTPGKIVLGAIAAGGVVGLAAGKQPLPFQLPEIPVTDNIKLGLSIQGPLNRPTSGMLTFTFSESGSKSTKKASSDYRRETEELRRSLEMFKPKVEPQVDVTSLPYAPTRKNLEETAVEPEAAQPEKKKAEEKGTIQRKEASAAPTTDVPPVVSQVLSSPGQPLAQETRAFIEPRFGHDFSQVQVHTDARAAESARAIDARAYTFGRHVVLARDNYPPQNQEEAWVLAHELAHVVQQSRGGSAPALDRASAREHEAGQAEIRAAKGTGRIPISGGSGVGIARLPDTASVPLFLPQDIDVSKMSPDRRKQLIAAIDDRLKYLDTQANKPASPGAGITIPGVQASDPGEERDRLFNWRQKLVSGTGVLVAPGIRRSSDIPAPVPPVSVSPAVKPTTGAKTSSPPPRAHASPPGYLAPKGKAETLEDVIAASNVDPHHKKESNPPGLKGFNQPDTGAMEAWISGSHENKPEGQKEANLPRAHATPPGMAPHGKVETLEDAIAASNADPHQARKKQERKITLPPPTPQEKRALEQYLRPRQPGEVIMPDGQKVIIPPKPPGELTEDITFGTSVLAKANVQGVRAMVVHNLDVELRRIQANAESSRWAAQRFLNDWPIMRRLADLAASADPPPASIWLAVDKDIQQSQDAIRDGDLEKAVGLTKQAGEALRNAQSDWGRYKDRNLGGAENLKSAAEGTRDAAKYTLVALAVVASGGTATAVATAGGIAIDTADVVSRAALGEKINWGEVTADIAIQVVTTKFGGKLSGGLLKALEGNPAAQGIERQILMKAVEGVMTGAESRTLGTVIRGAYQSAAAQGQPLTWDQFTDELIRQATDPKSVIIDLTIGVAKGMQASPAAGPGGARTGTTRATKATSTPPEDPYDVEAWNKYYAENPQARRSVGAAAKDDPTAFGGRAGSQREGSINLPPEKPLVSVGKFERGGAIEAQHLSTMPDYTIPKEHNFPGIDAWKGGREMTRETNSGKVRIIYGADVLQVKSIGSANPNTIRASVRGAIRNLEPNRFANDTGDIRVVNPKSRTLDVLFDEGALPQVGPETRQLLTDLSKQAGSEGIEVRWYRYSMGSKQRITIP